MAQFVITGIEIDGKPLKQFSSLSLSQEISAHHTFSLVCPSEAVDGAKGAVFEKSKNWVGASILIQVKAIGLAGSLEFAGLVTQVEASRFAGHAGDLILSGFGPTILMDNGPHCQTWEKKGIKDIAEEVLQPFPKNLLKTQLDPAFSDKLSYTVQYRETAWQFLLRLCAEHGEWLYYEGAKLVLGLEKKDSINLVYGNSLNRFNMAMQVKPASFKMMAYDYINHEVYNGSPNGTADKAGLSDLGKHALQKSEAFYTDQPKQWHNQFLTSKKQLDDRIATRAATQSSNMVRINGNSNHPGVQVGATIKVGGKNVFSLTDESFGEYTVISVNHHCDGQGNYSNDFTAIPATVKMPPETNCTEPYCETQSALVTDNHDEKGLGRVRVKFHWMEGNEKSPWLRVTSPHAGEGKGIFLMPEVGEEVIVGFEGDNPTKPYVIGSVYHGKAKCTFSNGGNDVKAFQSKSGNKLVLNDKDKSVMIEDAEGNKVMIDGKGNISISSSESIKLSCGDAILEMKKDGTVSITGKKAVEIKSDSLIKAEAKTVEAKADQELKVNGGAKISMNSPEIEQTADVAFKVSGKMVTVEGAMMTDIKGGMVQLNC
ncbi:type VI secretion system Vgr family protein [Cyclobacterium plantarum]|uniref:Type VI secretion system tip protein VgrG n=1 Tax=Cyclobacterium plantarum TaxID=2716263 RepID=A0ABX0HAV4_9BACT|nr:type VI secretion system tip protein VgrG [Cyclobacterium plantarum]NHE58495.1 type VI secretion system tip protein VgrG [Cyclobacterium plantarum]